MLGNEVLGKRTNTGIKENMEVITKIDIKWGSKDAI